MRRYAILASLLFLACEAEPPPPGMVIGTFDFVATLEAEGACILEDVAEVPQSISFSAILSHDPETGKLWFRSGVTEQSGTLDENRFTVKTPDGDDGIPREFAACTIARGQQCAFSFQEIIRGEILSDCPQAESFQATSGLPCPERREDGTLLWHNCACARGTLEEVVRFEPQGDEVCTCIGRTRTEPVEGECRLVYRLEGEKQ